MSNVAPAVALPTVEGFVIHRELGHGGMGNVYLARRTGSTGWVALKTVTASGEPVARAHARFSREIAAVSRIDHPNVVRLLGHGGNDGAPYALFEHVDGCDLGCIRGQLPWPVVVHLARQLARAIGAVHDAGLIHRDIKPANVMVSRTCRLTLIDFGLAKLDAGDEWDDDLVASSLDDGLDHDLTAPGSVAGTPRYLAPEVRLGEPPSTASDLFSFGLVLYQMLTGRSPSTETKASDLDHLDMPRLLRNLVGRCLEPDPAARPRRASAVTAVLDALDAQPGVIVRACTAGPAAGRDFAMATTRFLGVGSADATLPTEVVGPVVVRVEPLLDRHARGGSLPDDHSPVGRRSPRGSSASSVQPGVEPTWFPTLPYPRRSRRLALCRAHRHDEHAMDP
jgi:serine/threonine protein kinase